MTYQIVKDFLYKYRKIIWPVLIIIFSFPTFWSLIRVGYFPMHDDMQPTRVYDMTKCLTDLQIPCRWVPDMGYRFGYPQYNYYGPLPYYFMSLINLLGVNIFDSVKIGFIAPLILGNLAMFYLGLSLFGETGAFAAAILYAYSPYRGSDIYSRGAMGETWAYVFLPLIVLAIKKLSEKPGKKYAAMLALSFGALLATHNVTTLIFTPLVLVYAIYLILSKSKLNFKKLFLESKQFIIAFLWGGAIAAFFFLPVVFEKQFAHTETMIGGYFDYRAHFVAIKQLFFTSFWGYGSSEMGPTDDLSFFFSPVMLLAMLVSVILLAIKLLKRKISGLEISIFIFLILGLFSTFMTHEKSSMVWSLVPPLVYLQFPWRFLVIANFFFAIVGAYAFSYLSLQRSKWLIISFFVVTFLFSAPLFRPNYWLDLSPQEKLSGYLWDKQMTISIFDYLPTSAKTPPTYPAPFEPLSSTKYYSIEYLKKGTDWVSFDYQSDQDSSVSLNLLDFPGWKVFDQGKLISHYDDKNGIITINLPAGAHHIEARLTNTPIRIIGNLLTLIFLPYAIYLVFKKEKHVS